MANHVRQQIRERVATTLTGLTTTGSKVYQSRVYPLAANNLPGLLVFTNSETSEPDQMGRAAGTGARTNTDDRGICERHSEHR
jgi:hypothetical protein